MTTTWGSITRWGDLPLWGSELATVPFQAAGDERLRYKCPPIFTQEGRAWYQKAYYHNRAFAKDAPYKTFLSHDDERDFQHWVTDNNVPFNVGAKINDYDMRGYWHDVIKPGGTWTGGHFPDTWKTPYDTSFSAESKYATNNCPFHWHGNLLVDQRNLRIVFNDTGYCNNN
jgi:hypothetical protein